MNRLLHSNWKISKLSAKQHFKFSYEVLQQMALHDICGVLTGNALRQIAILYFVLLMATCATQRLQLVLKKIFYSLEQRLFLEN